MLALGFGAFLQFGVLLVLVGAYQPSLAASLGLDLESTGLLGATTMLGLALGVFLSGPIIDRGPGRRPLFVASALLCGASLLTVDGGMGFARALLHVFVIGFGAGFYETVLNISAIARYGDDVVRRLALLHSAATLGAMLAPLCIEVLASDGAAGDFVTGFRVVGAAHVALAIWGFFSKGLEAGSHENRTPAVPPKRDVSTSPARPSIVRLLARPPLLALLVGSFFYIGVETGITLFTVPYAEQGLGLDLARGRAGISAFWFGLLAMRLVMIFSPFKAGARMMVASGLIGGLLLAGGTVSGWDQIELLLALIGLSLGGLFPLMVGLAGQSLPEARGTAVAIVGGLGSIGGFGLPWLLGAVGDAIGVAAVMGCLAAFCLVIGLAGLVVYERPTKPR